MASSALKGPDPYLALFGGVLAPGIPVRYIYVDEAGTTAPEPVTVVVGIIVKPDEHWIAARQEIRRLLDTVPSNYRSNFHFHAMSVWGNKKYREGWSQEDRLNLILGFASIPIRLGMSIAVGKMRRDAGGQETLDQFNLNKYYSLAQWHHARAFSACAQKADAFLHERCAEGEIATLIAEDIPEMRRSLRAAFEVTKRLYVPPHILGANNGRLHQGISQIQDGVQFADKANAPLLQIADACAFCLRRFFSEQSFGEQLVSGMGLSLNVKEWLGPYSATVFTNEKLLRSSPYPLVFPDES